MGSIQVICNQGGYRGGDSSSNVCAEHTGLHLKCLNNNSWTSGFLNMDSCSQIKVVRERAVWSIEQTIILFTPLSPPCNSSHGHMGVRHPLSVSLFNSHSLFFFPFFPSFFLLCFHKYLFNGNNHCKAYVLALGAQGECGVNEYRTWI